MKLIPSTQLFANCPSSIYGTGVFYARAILNLPCTAQVKSEAVLCTAQVETVAVLCTAKVETIKVEVDDINGIGIMTFLGLSFIDGTKKRSCLIETASFLISN